MVTPVSPMLTDPAYSMADHPVPLMWEPHPIFQMKHGEVRGCPRPQNYKVGSPQLSELHSYSMNCELSPCRSTDCCSGPLKNGPESRPVRVAEAEAENRADSTIGIGRQGAQAGGHKSQWRGW